MDIPCKTAVTAAVAGGYLLGRTKKAKLAFVLGSLVAGRRFGPQPSQLATEGMRQLMQNPKLAELRDPTASTTWRTGRAGPGEPSASADASCRATRPSKRSSARSRRT